MLDRCVRIAILACLIIAPLSASALPTVQNVVESSGQIGLYDKQELTFDVTTVATNLSGPMIQPQLATAGRI